MEDNNIQKENDLSMTSLYMNIGTTEGYYGSTVGSPIKLEKHRPNRTNQLWSRLRAIVKTASHLHGLSKDIHLYGTQPTYCTMVQETLHKPSSGYLFQIDSIFIKIWAYILWPFLMWTAVGLPFTVSFERNDPWELEIFIDFLVFLNMLIMINSMHTNSSYKIITDRKNIIIMYIKGWFIYDIIAVMPVEFWAWAVNDKDDSWYDLLKYLKLFRLFLLYRYSSTYQGANFLGRWLKETKASKKKSWIEILSSFFSIFKVLTTYFIVVHIIGCFWFLLGRLQYLDYDSWINRYSIRNQEVLSQYIASIYFVFATLTTIGYGDIVAWTKSEKIFAIFLMAFGGSFYSYTISNWMSKFASIDKRRALIDSRLNSLKDLASDINLPEETKKKIKRTILENFKENLSGDMNEKTMLHDLPSSLKAEVTLYLYRRVISKIYFFKLRDPLFLSTIVPRLKSMTCDKSEFLYREGEIADEMYFLKKGRVLFRASNGVAFRTMVDGSYFGEHEIITNSLRLFSIEVSMTSSFLVLSKKDFNSIMSEFPEIYEEVREIDKIRAEKFSESIAHSLNLIPNEKTPESEESASESISESSSSSSSEEEAKKNRYLRADTGIMVSSLQFSADKFKNLSLWSHVLSTHNKGPRRSSTVFAGNDDGVKMMKRRKRSILSSAPSINVVERKHNRHRSATLDWKPLSTVDFTEIRPPDTSSQRNNMRMAYSTQATKLCNSENWIYDEDTLTDLLGVDKSLMEENDGGDSNILVKISNSEKKINQDHKIISDSIVGFGNQQEDTLRNLYYIEELIKN